MTDRRATVVRDTNETQIELTLALDGTGQADIDTGVGFFDHMLHHVAVHGLFDLSVKASHRRGRGDRAGARAARGAGRPAGHRAHG